MKQLVVVRHAHAHGLEPGLEDFERRLDRRGRAEAEAMAEKAKDLALVPDHLITSPADRAVATAREFARALGFPLPRIRHDDRVYLAEPERLVAIVRGLPDDLDRVMVVGHNPGLSQFAAWLTGEDLGQLPTAAMYAARGDLASWRDLDRGVLERVAYEWPR
jgi:phosphohistidine phosphatase